MTWRYDPPSGQPGDSGAGWLALFLAVLLVVLFLRWI